jgi:hypothetical protein
MSTEAASSPYREAIKSALVQQGIVSVLTAAILDGGDMFQFA